MPEHGKGLRLAIAGGGTGGHVLPALAVLEVLKRRGDLDDAFWIGSHTGFERQAAADAGVRFVAIPTGKFRRYLSIQNVTDAARVPAGIIAARNALRAGQPGVVFSTGGFVSVPTVVAALRVAPVLTHEQTAILGMANRINARFASVLAISHAQTASAARALHPRVALTGNPVRAGLLAGDRQRGLAWMGFDPGLPVVFVTGGARGASPINQRVAALIPGILDIAQLLHQTGPADANSDALELSALRARLPESQRSRYKIVEFVRDELPDVYAAVDIIVGRSGAGTVAEVAYVGKPAVFIPLPGAGGDEQAVNAQVLEQAGAAVVIPQHEATPERLEQELRALLGDPARRHRMAAAAKTAAAPGAAEAIADILLELASERATVRPRRVLPQSPR